MGMQCFLFEITNVICYFANRENH